MSIKEQSNNTIDPISFNANEEDLTGRDRLVSNVLFSWATYFVFIVGGFILPRMIDHHLGQELLGIWDFGWSLVSYFGLVQAGVGSGVNRYVAKYRVAKDKSGLNQFVSSACCILCIAGALVMGLSVIASLLLPLLFGTRLGHNVLDAQWVVFFLGASMSAQIALGGFSGVLTGCHRWELHNIIKSGSYTIIVTGIIVALFFGADLSVIAMINLVGTLLGSVAYVILAYWVCEGLQVRPDLVGWTMIKRLFVFGGKTLIPSVSNLLLNQTTSILIVAYLGPAALALYTRPRSLIRHINTLVNKMAFALTPTTSSLQSKGNVKEIRELLITAVRYSLYLVLPMILVLVIFGGPILQLWMGPRYANGLLPAILALGYLATMAQAPVLNVLAGMNAHGRAGIAQLVASLCAVGLTLLALSNLQWGILGAAIAITLPLTIMNIVYLPSLICSRVNLNIWRYFWFIISGPTILMLPFAVCLLIARLVLDDEPLKALAFGAGVGAIILAALYWGYVLPERIKIRISQTIGNILICISKQD